MAKLVKTESELNTFMWKEYPNENSTKQYQCRVAMKKAYDFLTGKIDADEKLRKEIADEIYQKLTKEGL